jgi:hypothetical protein
METKMRSLGKIYDAESSYSPQVTLKRKKEAFLYCHVKEGREKI